MAKFLDYNGLTVLVGQIKTLFSSHTNKTDNPHSVTKVQIGLENVENKSSETIRGELTKSNVTTALGYTPAESTGDIKWDDIQNKPETFTPSSHTHTVSEITDIDIPDSLSDLSDDESHRLVTDTEKATWNAKSNFSGSYDDLDNKPTIPDSLDDLSDDATHRLVTDTQISNWNAKSNFSGSYNDLTNKPTIPSKASDVGAVATSSVGANNGIAQLDANGKVPSSQLPSFVDDVLEYVSKEGFPTTGETGKIYVALNTNLTYRWSGSEYVEISPSIALGETSSTAYAGDKGKAVTDALSTHKNDTTSHITSAERTSWNAKQSALSESQLNAVNSGITSTKVSTYDGYATTIGNKVDKVTGKGLSTNDLTDTLKSNYDAAYTHSTSTHARTDATKTEASTTNGNIKINGTETTVYTHPGSGTNPHGTTKSDVGLGNVGNFKAVSTVASQGLTDTEKSNARANIGAGTSSFSGSYNDLTNKPTIPSGAAASKGVDTSISAASTSTNLPTSAAVASFVEGKGYKTTDNNTTYTLTQDSTDGHKITLTPSTGSATTITIPDKNTWNANAVNTAGYVSAPTSSNANKVWKTDASGNPGWRDDANTTYSVATTSANGLMSSTDKTKLDGLRKVVIATSEPTINNNDEWLLEYT